jgi:hypothetical protein
MKRIPLLTLLIFATSISASGQTVTCPNANSQNQQYRGDLKHRERGAETGTSITISDVYALPNVTAASVNSNTNKHRAMPGSAEAQTFTLDALLRQAKVEGNDCEIHLEFSQTARANARRVIAEIPPDPDFSSDYQTILRLMQSRFPRRRILGPGVKYVFAPPVHMRVTGFGFFDGIHKSMAGPRRPNGGHGSASVKTFWELHPAWNVQCLPEPCQ